MTSNGAHPDVDAFRPASKRSFSSSFYRVAAVLPVLFLSLLLCSTTAGANQIVAPPVTAAILDSGDLGGVSGGPDSATLALPDAPTTSADSQQSQSSAAPSSTPGSTDPEEGRQTKRILGIVPNFRSVSASSHPPPQGVKDKFSGFVENSFDYSAFVFVAGVAGLNQLSNSTPEFHQGLKGYARYYWHTYVDQTDENLWVTFLLPVAFHQDPRYFTLGHGGAVKRTFYSFSRIVVTRTDSGRSAFNVSEVGGAAAAAGISNLYYPSQERTLANTGRQWGLNLGLDGVTFVFKEFWPDLNRAVFHQK